MCYPLYSDLANMIVGFGEAVVVVLGEDQEIQLREVGGL